jgi:hypothetical protein
MLLMTLLTIAGTLAASGEKRVQPTANPSAANPSEAVVIRFRTRETLDGVYSVEAHGAVKIANCPSVQSRRVKAPKKGHDVRLRVLPPRIDGERRWCAGDYRATVYFKQTVRCPRGASCGDSAEVPIGSTKFTVKSD